MTDRHHRDRKALSLTMDKTQDDMKISFRALDAPAYEYLPVPPPKNQLYESWSRRPAPILVVLIWILTWRQLTSGIFLFDFDFIKQFDGPCYDLRSHDQDLFVFNDSICRGFPLAKASFVKAKDHPNISSYINLQDLSIVKEAQRKRTQYFSYNKGKLHLLPSHSALLDGEVQLHCPCLYHVHSRWPWHFPHSMQQLYQCFDLWTDCKSVSNVTNMHLVFKSQSTMDLVLNRKDWVLGFLRMVEGYIGLKTWLIKTYLEAHALDSQAIIFPSFEFDDHGYLFRSSKQLVHAAEASFLHGLSPGTMAAQPYGCVQSPKISILSRKDSRKLISANEIAVRLQALLSSEKYGFCSSPNASSQVTVDYLEHKSFQEQVAMPWFYGSLTVSSQINHNYMYLSNDDVMPWETKVPSSTEEKKKVRGVDVCPPPSLLLQAVMEVVNDWFECRYPDKRTCLRQVPAWHTQARIRVAKPYADAGAG